MKLWLLLFCSCVGLSLQRSTPQDDNYIAAVVEYATTSNATANLNIYAASIQQAASQNADIVIFPELTLTSSTVALEVPINGSLVQYPIPALRPDLYDEVMVRISAAARMNQIYVVVNGRELVNCTTSGHGEYCPEAKMYEFNTNVVFDRTGAVIDRYRKINLFGERNRTPALRPDLGIFTTDFGVTFGHFICFDLMFQVPAVQVVQKYNIKDVIFPTMWFSEMPYLTAVQIQEAYAYALDINFLGAGGNNPRVGSTGSGIYSGKAGALTSIMSGVSTTQVLVAKVPKVPGKVTEPSPGPIVGNPAEHDNLRLKTDLSLPSHITKLLQPGFQEVTLTHRDITCMFRVNLRNRNGTDMNYRYRAAAFSGVRSFDGVANGGVRSCAIYACTNDTRDSCAKRFPSYTENTTAIFEELTIIGVMPTPSLNRTLNADESIVYPVSMTVSILPLEPKEYSYSLTKNDNVTVHVFTLNNRDAELYSFGIWGRVFGRDLEKEDPPLTDDATVSVLSKMLMALVVAVVCRGQV